MCPVDIDTAGIICFDQDKAFLVKLLNRAANAVAIAQVNLICLRGQRREQGQGSKAKCGYESFGRTSHVGMMARHRNTFNISARYRRFFMWKTLWTELWVMRQVLAASDSRKERFYLH